MFLLDFNTSGASTISPSFSSGTHRIPNAFVKSFNKTCGPFVWTNGPEKLRRIIELTQKHQESLHTE